MTAPYVFTDAAGDCLTVVPSRTANSVDLIIKAAGARRREAVTVPAWKLGDLVAAMYRRAGQTVPVLINPDEVADDWVRHPKGGAA